MRAKCTNCDTLFEDFSGYSERATDGDAIEIGIECPNCKKWYHSHYVTGEIKELQDKILAQEATRQERRSYKHKFDKLQKTLRKKYQVEAPKVRDGNNQITA